MELSLLQLVNLVLRARRLIVGWGLAVAMIVIAVSLMERREYTVVSSFIPEGRSQLADIGGLASQFGLSLPNADIGESPEFYAELLRSDRILSDVAKTRYRGGEAATVMLAEALDIHETTEERTRELVMRRVRELAKARVSRNSGSVFLEVTMPDPQLAYEVATRFLALVADFNLKTRQSRGAAESKFTGARAREAKEALYEAEDRLQSFLHRNRSYTTSPTLVFEHDRLAREVATKQDIYSALAQAHEQARIEEVRNTPVLTIIEEPTVPVRPDSRRIALKAVLALLFGGMLGLGIGYFRDYARRATGQERTDIDEFMAQRLNVRSELRTFALRIPGLNWWSRR